MATHGRFTTAAVGLAVVVALACAGGAAAATRPAPLITDYSLHRADTGAHAGQLVAVARVSMADVLERRHVARRDGRPRLLRAVLDLSAGPATVRATDTVRLRHDAHVHGSAYLHFVVPAEQAAAIPPDVPVASRLTVGVDGIPMRRARLAPAGRRENQFPLQTCNWALFTAGCLPSYAPPPHAPIALDGSRGRTDAIACIIFHGSGTADPYPYVVELYGPNGVSIKAAQGDAVITRAADGSYVFGEQAWPGGPGDWAKIGSLGTMQLTAPAAVVGGGSGTASITWTGPNVKGVARPVQVVPSLAYAYRC